MFGTALYYPSIVIHDEEWLKTAYLFWDGIRTIVPESMVGSSYQNYTTQFLSEEGYLQPIRVSPNAVAVKSLVNVVKKYSQTDEGKACLNQPVPDDVYYNPYDDDRSQFYLHHEKMPFEIQQLVGDRIGPDGWARVSDNFADFYMTLLANTIASRKSMDLVTSSQPLESLSTDFSVDTYKDSFTMAGSRAESIGRCMLTKMIIDGITIDPLTSLDDLRIFKERHHVELKRFKQGFAEISKMDLPPDITIEGLGRKAKEIYENKFLLAYQDLQKSLKGAGIKYLFGGAAALMFSDVSSTFNELLSSLQMPTQLIIGAGATLAYQGYNTYKSRTDRIKHRMSYLLSIERELSRITRR